MNSPTKSTSAPAPKPVPPYYANWDNTHCVQCCLRGVLEYFEPNVTWTWPELDEFTAKEVGKWTWPYQVWVNMQARGYAVITHSANKLEDALTLGLYASLVKNRGQAAADKQREMSNLVAAEAQLQTYAACLNAGKLQRIEQEPTLAVIQNYLAQGYLVLCSLNYRKLYNLEGYSSHSVLIYGIDEQYVHFHDPEHQPGSKPPIAHAQFVAACQSPTPAQWGITAYKLG